MTDNDTQLFRSSPSPCPLCLRGEECGLAAGSLRELHAAIDFREWDRRGDGPELEGLCQFAERRQNPGVVRLR
jgi:hypothetical protein